jgi:hypothetical protein
MVGLTETIVLRKLLFVLIGAIMNLRFCGSMK